MKHKILFISANRFKEPYPVYPLGISYLCTYLRKHFPEAEMKVFDMNLHDPEDLSGVIHQFKPSYIGVSLRNVDNVDSIKQESFFREYQAIIKVCREHSQAPVLLGGSAYSIFPELFFKKLLPDYGFIGEGEKSLCEFIRRHSSGRGFLDIEGLVFQNNDRINVNMRKEYSGKLALAFDESLVNYYWSRSGMLNIQTKRGCPFHCIYCTYPIIEGHKVRTLDADEIVKTLSEMKSKKGIDYVFFTDSVFNIQKGFNTELAEKMIDAKLDVKWGGYFTIRDLDKEHLVLLKRAGLTHIEFGTESLSDKTLKNYGKSFTVDDVIKVSALCREVDVHYAHFLILGGFGEDNDTLNETFENSRKIERSVFFPYVGMRIYPGTRLHQIALKEGMTQKQDDLLEPAYYIAPGIDIEDLKARASKTGKRWVFPDEDLSRGMKRMRMKNVKGPLWEYLIQG